MIFLTATKRRANDWLICLLVAMTCICVVPSAFSESTYVEKGAPFVYHAYFRKVADEDPGTAHLFIKNITKQDLEVKKVRFNGYEMKDVANDWLIWYAAVPCVAKPGEIIDLKVKLREPTSKPVRISALLSNGEEVSTVIEPVPPVLKFSFIGYSKELDIVYLYLENMREEPLEITSIYCDFADITSACFIPEKSILPQEKIVAIYRPKKPFSPGEYHTFLTVTSEGTKCAATSRVYSYFPITAIGRDTNPELAFDADPFEMGFPVSVNGFRLTTSQPLTRAYHLFDDPACADAIDSKPVGAHAPEVVRRSGVCYRHDKVHPGIVFSCEYQKPYNYYIYGETSDIFAVDPYEMLFKCAQPMANAEFVALGKKASEPSLLWTIPQAFADRPPYRYPTPEEERLIVYSAIGVGSKGIWYSTSNPKYGYPSNPSLATAIGDINKELRLLRDYIVYGEPFDLCTASTNKVKVYSLLCGDRGIVLMLLNRQHFSSYIKGDPQFTFTPIEDFKVNCRIPPWLRVSAVSVISGGDEVPKEFVNGPEGTEIPVERLDVTMQILIKTERKT